MKLRFIMLILMLYFSNTVCTERVALEDITSLENENKMESADEIIVVDAPQECEGEITAVMKWMKNISDNEQSADELIKTVYTEDELTNFDPRLKTIVDKNIAECVRMFDENVFYIVLKSQSRYLFLEFDLTQNIHYPVNITYSNCKLVLSDFDSILPNVSTIIDVMSIDSYGKYSSPAQSIPLSSVHYTLDGYRIYITYSMSKDTEPYLIEKIIKNEIPHSLNEILLKQDREMLL